MDTETQGDGRQVRPFADWLREVRRGALHDELSEGVQELVQACQETGKPGTMILKIKVTPSDASVYAHLEVSDDFEVKPPKPDLPSTVFYADRDANLVRTDPRQQAFGLQGLDGGRSVDAGTGEISEAGGAAQ